MSLDKISIRVAGLLHSLCSRVNVHYILKFHSRSPLDPLIEAQESLEKFYSGKPYHKLVDFR